MLHQSAPPQFGGKLCTAEYYTNVAAAIATLRPLSTLRFIAAQLNKSGFLTPAGLPWNRDRLANFIRNTTLPTVKESQ